MDKEGIGFSYFYSVGTELANDRVKLFLEEERSNGVGSLEDAWKRVQLIWLALMLRLNAVSLLMLCGLALWDRFLIERSKVCDDEKICFVGSLDAVKDWNREPIKNCSNVTNIDEVVCFRFAYNLSDTIGLVGGILSFGIYSMRVGATVMNFLYKLLFRCRNKKANRICASFLQQVPLCIMLITAAITVALVKVRDLTFYGTLIETFGIASTIALVLATPWSAFVNPLDTKFTSKIEDIVDREEAEKGVQNTL